MKPLWIVLLCLCSFVAFGQSQQGVKTKVSISCSCPDMLGIQLHSKMRDIIARSPRFTEVPLASQFADLDSDAWIITIDTLVDEGDGHDPKTIAISSNYIVGKMVFVGKLLQVCGAQRLDNCADRIFASFDKATHR